MAELVFRSAFVTVKQGNTFDGNVVGGCDANLVILTRFYFADMVIRNWTPMTGNNRIIG